MVSRPGNASGSDIAKLQGRSKAKLEELASGKRKLPPLPTEAQLTEMMNVCVGERVPAEYAGMAMEDMGFRPRELHRRAPAAAVDEGFKVIVVGAGVSGICAGHHLKKLGIPFEILEKNTDLGGVWLENTWTGAAVTPSARKSGTTSARYSMTSAWPSTPTSGVEVSAMQWDDGSARWQVTTRDAAGRETRRWANAVITAAGNLNRPKLAAVRRSRNL